MCTVVCTERRQQFERTKAKENECAEEKRARAPRTFGFPGAADNVTFSLHGMHEGRSMEDVSSSPICVERGLHQVTLHLLVFSLRVNGSLPVLFPLPLQTIHVQLFRRVSTCTWQMCWG